MRGHLPRWSSRLAVAGLVGVVSAEAAVLALRGSTAPVPGQAVAAAAATPSTSPTSIGVTPSTVSSTPTTTQPSPKVTSPTTTVVNAPGSITYTLTAAPSVTISAEGDSWIEVRSAAGAPIIHVGTLTAGEHATYPVPVWIRSGNPAVITVTAGGNRLAVPNDRGPIDVIVVSPSSP